jgi:hypothetical protein
MIYSESISGLALTEAKPGKPVREFTLLIEAATGTDQDDAQQQIHDIIEDIEACMQAYAKAQFLRPELNQTTPMAVVDIAILDRPEGAAVIAMQARVVARYFR